MERPRGQDRVDLGEDLAIAEVAHVDGVGRTLSGAGTAAGAGRLDEAGQLLLLLAGGRDRTVDDRSKKGLIPSFFSFLWCGAA